METRIPRHVAVIMDGNGRWAKERLLPRSAGHRAGLDRMMGLTRHAFERGVRALTLFALSCENLSRSKEELDGLFSLFRKFFSKNVPALSEEGIRLRVIGDKTLLPADIGPLIEEAENVTGKNENGILTVALGYGGRQEILRAVNRAVKGGRELTGEEFSALLYTAGLPDPDLLIRTGREKRLSNFLLYQAAYSELYFTDKLFPDFSDADFDAALADYSRRERKFGRT